MGSEMGGGCRTCRVLVLRCRIVLEVLTSLSLSIVLLVCYLTAVGSLVLWVGRGVDVLVLVLVLVLGGNGLC